MGCVCLRWHHLGVTEPFVFSGSDPCGRTVTFSSLEQPYGDSLTTVSVRLDAKRLSASSEADLLDGDEGLDGASHELPGGGTRFDPLKLSRLLIDLGRGPLWGGSRRWRTLGNELAIELVVDSTGHVEVGFRLVSNAQEPTWSASTKLTYAMGDLASTGDALARWVDAQLSP